MHKQRNWPQSTCMHYYSLRSDSMRNSLNETLRLCEWTLTTYGSHADKLDSFCIERDSKNIWGHFLNAYYTIYERAQQTTWTEQRKLNRARGAQKSRCQCHRGILWHLGVRCHKICNTSLNGRTSHIKIPRISWRLNSAIDFKLLLCTTASYQILFDILSDIKILWMK